jgi:3-oxoacyl-[acyl-carrier protein] reductase
MERQFADKSVIVTGASSGICRVILQSFVRAGAKGVIADVNEDWGQQVARDLQAAGGTVMFVKTDVRTTAAVERLFDETVRAYGAVDVLVNCAGVGVHKSVVEMTDAEWDFQVDTQLRAVFLTCRAAARRMIERGRGGRIINIGSGAGAIARVEAAAHCASKAGAVHFTKVLALELGRHGITVNVVAPGLTDIKAVSNTYPTDEYIDNHLREIPVGRLAKPQEIANMVMFLASDQAQFITGQAIYVDGGYSAGKLSIGGPHRHVYQPTPRA